MQDIGAIFLDPFVDDNFAVRVEYILQASEEPAGASRTRQIEEGGPELRKEIWAELPQDGAEDGYDASQEPL